MITEGCAASASTQSVHASPAVHNGQEAVLVALGATSALACLPPEHYTNLMNYWPAPCAPHAREFRSASVEPSQASAIGWETRCPKFG